MQVVTTLSELQAARAALPGPVGLVPTMGYLHQGHLSLVQTARKDCPSVVVSIFVNPTQFGPQEDLDKYPRDLDRDLELLQTAGASLVWAPTPEIMYPSGFQTWVTVEDLTTRLEGEIRPGHFRGVTTVVAKLFHAVQPQKAYFGQKDAQQALVIRRMVEDLNFPIELVICPIVREPDGLALSSRNIYLNPEERRDATVLSRALGTARTLYNQGERSGKRLREAAMEVFAAEPLARVQYISLADAATLTELDTVTGPALMSTAVYIGKTRLIDNVLLG
jgi:pantoate--beta-alanine ligase